MLRHGMKLFEQSEFFIRCLVFNQIPEPLIFLEFRSGDKSTRQHLGGGYHNISALVFVRFPLRSLHIRLT